MLFLGRFKSDLYSSSHRLVHTDNTSGSILCFRTYYVRNNMSVVSIVLVTSCGRVRSLFQIANNPPTKIVLSLLRPVSRRVFHRGTHRGVSAFSLETSVPNDNGPRTLGVCTISRFRTVTTLFSRLFVRSTLIGYLSPPPRTVLYAPRPTCITVDSHKRE